MSEDRPVRIYRVTHISTGRSYIGVTNRRNPKMRWTEHARAASNGATGKLARAIKKYGPDAFRFEVLYEAVDRLEACMVERGLIAQYGTLGKRGFNLSGGGEGSAGVVRGQSTRELLRQAHLGKRWSDESKAKASAAKKGKPWTDAQRAAILPAITSPEYREKQRVTHTGRAGIPATPEQKEKCRARQLARMALPENREALSIAAKAQMAQPGMKEGIAERAKARWADPEKRIQYLISLNAKANEPAIRTMRSEIQTQRMADPKNRKALSEIIKAKHQDPEYHARYMDGRRKKTVGVR